MTFYAPATHTRRTNDHYPTPPDLARALPLGLPLAGIVLPRPLYDPCCGDGALLDALGSGFGSDLCPRSYPYDQRRNPISVDARDPDALAAMLGPARSLVTNPPYGRDAQPIVEAGVELVRKGAIELAAFLVPLPWESAGGRVDLLRRMRVRVVPCWRSVWVPGTQGGGKMNYVWLVWTRDLPTFPITVYLRKPGQDHDPAP
jgi:hypothetical protein